MRTLVEIINGRKVPLKLKYFPDTFDIRNILKFSNIYEISGKKLKKNWIKKYGTDNIFPYFFQKFFFGGFHVFKTTFLNQLV